MESNYFRVAGEVTAVAFDAAKGSVTVSLRCDDADADYIQPDKDGTLRGSGLRVALFDAVEAVRDGRIVGMEHADKGALIVASGHMRFAKGAAWLNATSLTFDAGIKAPGLKGLAEAAA